MSINARVIAVQSLENLFTFILFAAAIFSYNIIENSPTSLTHNFVFDGPNDFKYGTETYPMESQVIENLEKIDQNLRNHIFNNVI